MATPPKQSQGGESRNQSQASSHYQHEGGSSGAGGPPFDWEASGASEPGDERPSMFLASAGSEGYSGLEQSDGNLPFDGHTSGGSGGHTGSVAGRGTLPSGSDSVASGAAGGHTGSVAGRGALPSGSIASSAAGGYAGSGGGGGGNLPSDSRASGAAGGRTVPDCGGSFPQDSFASGGYAGPGGMDGSAWLNSAGSGVPGDLNPSMYLASGGTGSDGNPSYGCGAGASSSGGPHCPNLNHFDDMKVRCPGCNAPCSLKIRFNYFGLNRHNPLEQEIRYFISMAGMSGSGSGPGAHNHPQSGAQGQMSPQLKFLVYDAKYYQQFEGMALACPGCNSVLNLKTSFSYLGPNHENRYEHDIKLRLKVTDANDGQSGLASTSRPASAPAGGQC